jgi:hypothetical protein
MLWRWGWSVWLVLLACGAAAISTGCRANHSSGETTSQRDQHNALFHATGRIVSVEEQAHDEQSYDLLPGPRVCFTIDSFDEVPRIERNVYETAERERQAAHGARCRDTSIDPSAVHIKAGDGVDVHFKLESAGQISIVSVTASGVDL